MINITLNNARGGTLSAPFVALTVETLAFSGTAPEDGTTVALLSPSGDTLASTHVAGGQATLNLNTIQADAATRYTEVGTTIPVVLAIGDTDHLQALIQTTLQRNPLDTLAPPTVSAPIYPTNAELKAILTRINTVLQAANQTAGTIAQDAQRVDRLVNVTLPHAVEEIDTHLDERVRAAERSVDKAATDAANTLSDAAKSAASALDGKVSAASTALDNKLAAAQTALDGKVSAANNAATAADGSAKAASKARDDAETFKGNAADSAQNAATSADNAKTSEANAKASATQAENATALKVDQRVNTADNSEYPLIVMVDKDVYKFLAPKGLTNTSNCRYCCDGVEHYFCKGDGGAKKGGRLYVYDGNLVLKRSFPISTGQLVSNDPYTYGYDFCTNVDGYYYLREIYHPYTTMYLVKYDNNGVEMARCVIASVNAMYSYVRICRNERTKNIIVFDRFTDIVENGDGTTSTLTRGGYTIYNANLEKLGERRLDDSTSVNYNSWLRHLNIVGNTTFVAFAQKDATKTSLYYLDENDDIKPIDSIDLIRGSGEFTSDDKNATGRTNGTYFIPRMFYNQRLYTNGTHQIYVTNGARWYRVFVSKDKVFSCDARWAISTSSVPNNKYSEGAFYFANGSGSNDGGAVFEQPIVCLTASGIVTKVASAYGYTGYTDFAPDPFANIGAFYRAITGNCRLANDSYATSRNLQLYPAGAYGQVGGAIMFTV